MPGKYSFPEDLPSLRKWLKILLVSTVFSILLSILVIGLFFSSATKIGYVRSEDLVSKYAGMIEAKNIYNRKAEAWRANIDTLKVEYERALNDFKKEYVKMTLDERQIQQNLLEKKQENVIQYSKAIDAKSKEEDEKMTTGVLNQINSFVEEYGKENDYDAIFGTTLNGNLLYGKNAIDLTDELLEALNEHYYPTNSP